MRKERITREETVTIEEDVYVISWEELKIIHEMCSKNMIRCAHHSDGFLKLEESVSHYIYYK